MDEVDLQVLHELTDDEEILAYSELCCTHASDHLRSNRLDVNYTLSKECVQQFCFRKGPVFLEDATAVARQARGFNLSCLQWERDCVWCFKEIGLLDPNRLSDLVPIFSLHRTHPTIILNLVLEHVHSSFQHLISDLNQPWLEEGELRRYACITQNARYNS